MKLIITVLLCIALLAVTRSFGQDGEKVLFHVTAVQSGDAHDWCTTGKCSATRFTVEGYTDSVAYVLQCVEVIANEPSPHYANVCVHVHSHHDYEATLGTNYILFGESHKASDNEPIEVAYEIVSEKEISKHNRQ